MISLITSSLVKLSIYSATTGTFSSNTSTTNPNVRSIVSIANNSFTNTNAASASDTISASTLIALTASNTSLIVATSLPVNSFTTACNSGNTLIILSISFSNEIPSYNPSSAFESVNLANTELIASSTSSA